MYPVILLISISLFAICVSMRSRVWFISRDHSVPFISKKLLVLFVVTTLLLSCFVNKVASEHSFLLVLLVSSLSCTGVSGVMNLAAHLSVYARQEGREFKDKALLGILLPACALLVVDILARGHAAELSKAQAILIGALSLFTALVVITRRDSY